MTRRRMFGLVLALAVVVVCYPSAAAEPAEAKPAMPRGYSIPTIDLADQTHRQVIVDKEAGQYLGHPTTVLLEDNKEKRCQEPFTEQFAVGVRPIQHVVHEPSGRRSQSSSHGDDRIRTRPLRQ